MIINYSKFEKKLDNYCKLAKNEQIFIHPTDSIYWIWWIVTKNVVDKIYTIKSRPSNKPLSIIAPNVERIKKHFIVKYNFEDEIEVYFNKYKKISILLKKQNRNFLSCLWDLEYISVRIINHKFQNFVNKLWECFISTSLNLSWENHIEDISNIPNKIKEKVSLIIDDWKLEGTASTIIKYDNWEIIR